MATISASLPVPRRDRAQRPLISSDMPLARWGVILNALVPLALLIYDALRQQLGVNAVNFAIHTTGMLALVFLLLSLCITPLRSITGWSWLIQFRRSLGLFGFFYACVHLFIYYQWDRGGSLRSTLSEILNHNYLMVGISALLLMVPLAATSANFMLRAMGGKKWKALHRLAYFAAAYGCWHYYMEVKADHRLPMALIEALTVLLAYRLFSFLIRPALGRGVAKRSVDVATGEKARFWKGNLRVAATRKETSQVRTFRLVPENGGPIPFRFSAGQFLNLTLYINGKKVGRSYTIASPPTRDGYVELTIKREERGIVSAYLHDMVQTGGSVAVSAPAGRFTFSGTEADRLLLIAGGVGITPVMSILRDLTDRGWAGAVDLLFSVRTPADVIFEGELREIAAQHPNVHVHLAYTREAPEGWLGPRGRITAGLLKSIIPDLPGRLSYICGPDEMAQAVRQELLAAGLAPSRIKVESFTPAAAVEADEGRSPAAEMASASVATVTFAISGRTASLSGTRSVLEAAESVGVEIDNDCRSGICGRCRTKLLSGDVTMAVQDALSDGDIADGYILACQAHARADVSVEA